LKNNVFLQKKYSIMIDKFRELIQREAEAVLNIPIDGNIEKAIGLIHNRVVKQGGKLITGGMGKAGQIAMNIASTFASTGTPAVFLHPSEAQHGDLGIIQPMDVLLLISNSGKTREILELLTLSKRLCPNIPSILLTGNPETELAKNCQIAISTGNPPELCPLGMTPTSSITVMHVIGNMLIVGMMEKTGFTREEYAKRHHGGYIGQQLK